MERVILHCDMNNYFATVEEKFDPKLRNIPFAVCGDPEMRHSIVLAKNNLAKKAGVLTGISFHQAKEICPGLGYVKADYQKYLAETKFSRKIYKKYTDTIIPYGLDESWIDLTETGVSMSDGKQIADIIRLEIMYTQRLSASVGVSDNLIFAKLGSDYKKPNATTLISKDNYKQVLWPLPASDLLFVGGQRKKLLSKIGIRTIGDIATAEPEILKKLLGNVGCDLWRYANGDDRSFTPVNDKIGSIGNTITPPEDLHSIDEVSAILYLIVNSICTRLKKHDMKAYCISISAMDNRFCTITRQCSLDQPSDSVNLIFNQAYALFQRSYRFYYPLRSLGVRVSNLISGDYRQLSLFEEDTKICVDIDKRIQKLTSRFGELNPEKTATSKEWI